MMKIIITVFFVILFSIIFVKSYETFNIRLEKAHGLYIDYRNLIDGYDHLLTRNKPKGRLFPYKISSNCFADKYQKCLCKSKKNEKICEDQSLNQCVLPVMMSE